MSSEKVKNKMRSVMLNCLCELKLYVYKSTIYIYGTYKPFINKKIHNQLFISVGFPSMDSTNCKSKIFRKKEL
jgi:hypothetical protein